MTKQQPCATSLPPSKLCRLLIIAFAVKLVVLGMLIVEPSTPGSLFGPALFSDIFGRSTANAATGEGVGAPPPLEATLPDVGMDRPFPGAPVGPGTAQTPGEAGGQDAAGGALPAITPRAPSPDPAAPGANALAPDVGLDALARRQEDLARKEQELRVLESELNARLERMKMLENRLAGMIKDADEAGDAKFRHLVDVLSNMKSKQAAAVLETLDPKIAVRVLAGMRGRQAGEILTFVKPEIAAKLTESLARMQLPME